MQHPSRLPLACLARDGGAFTAVRNNKGRHKKSCKHDEMCTQVRACACGAQRLVTARDAGAEVVRPSDTHRASSEAQKQGKQKQNMKVNEGINRTPLLAPATCWLIASTTSKPTMQTATPTLRSASSPIGRPPESRNTCGFILISMVGARAAGVAGAVRAERAMRTPPPRPAAVPCAGLSTASLWRGQFFL